MQIVGIGILLLSCILATRSDSNETNDGIDNLTLYALADMIDAFNQTQVLRNFDGSI